MRQKTFFYLDDISPGSSHPSNQRGARPLTVYLPTTSPPHHWPLNFENSFLLYYTAYGYIASRVLSISLTLDNHKRRLHLVKPQLISRKSCQNTRRMAGQATGHPQYLQVSGRVITCRDYPLVPFPCGFLTQQESNFMCFCVFFWDLSPFLLCFCGLLYAL